VILPALLLILLGGAAAAPATVEEVAAVVGSVPILDSDLELALMVALLERDSGEQEAAYRSRLLDARIRLELQFRHLEETGALYRLSFDQEEVVRQLEQRLGSDPEGRLATSGLTRGDLGELALRLAATRAYVEERLRPRVEVSRAEIEAEYRRVLEQEPARGASPAPPLEAVADQLRRVLVERKLNAEIEQWLAQARERLPVSRLRP
jgi:hypothetical protein